MFQELEADIELARMSDDFSEVRKNIYQAKKKYKDRREGKGRRCSAVRKNIYQAEKKYKDRREGKGRRCSAVRKNIFQAKKKYKDRREGKGRRGCSAGDRIDSTPCRASYFAPG